MIDELESTNEANAWWYLPSLIEFLKKARNENPGEKFCMNISIILHSAIIIEGFLNELLSDFVGMRMNDKSLEDRLNIELAQRIDKSSWLDLQYLYGLIFGRELSHDSGNAEWKGVNSLFDLRNMLMHGKTMRVSVYSKSGIRKVKLFGKYEKVYKHLAQEKKVIQQMNLKAEYPHVDLITNESVDYYWQTTKNFISCLVEIHKNNMPTIESSFEIAFDFE